MIFFIDAKYQVMPGIVFVLDFLHGFFFSMGIWATPGDLQETPQEIATRLIKGWFNSHASRVGNWDFPSYRELTPTKNMTKKNIEAKRHVTLNSYPLNE